MVFSLISTWWKGTGSSNILTIVLLGASALWGIDEWRDNRRLANAEEHAAYILRQNNEHTEDEFESLTQDTIELQELRNEIEQDTENRDFLNTPIPDRYR